MIKKYKNHFCSAIFVFVVLCIIFFSSSINKASAINLEVPSYPPISGTTITANSGLPDYALYLYKFGVAIGFFAVFLSLAISGVMWLLSPISPQLKANAKDRIAGSISGLLILALAYLIITTINPQLAILKFKSLPPPPQSTITATKNPGVYFYNSGGCSDDSAQPNISAVPDLGALKNRVNSVGIAKGLDAYISIIYDTINFQGKCQYLDPNKNCDPVTPFANSASIYKYDFNPNGDGVYFYRKSYFNEAGGFYKVPNSQISGIYIADLEDLKFTGVPLNEQDCIKYDKAGECIGRVPPSLGGENISSVKIKGSYAVLFVYAAPKDEPRGGPWTYCQELPTIDDINKIGPQQIKWESIRTGVKGIPNFVVIFPIKY